MPFNYKSNPSHMLIENIDLTVSSISETSLTGTQREKKNKEG